MSVSKEADEFRSLHVRLNMADSERLEAVAKANFRTVSDHIRFLINKDYEEREKAWSQ